MRTSLKKRTRGSTGALDTRLADFSPQLVAGRDNESIVCHKYAPDEPRPSQKQRTLLSRWRCGESILVIVVATRGVVSGNKQFVGSNAVHGYSMLQVTVEVF
jgi:hypothetical protein